ncbi:YPDG domain-containing protein, partial [Corynebacterium riegelii]
MQGKNIARRRGTSVAAAALSFALVAPFAQPVAVPEFAAQAAAMDTSAISDQTLAGLIETLELDETVESLREKLVNDEVDWAELLQAAAEKQGVDPLHTYWANGGKPGVTQPKLQDDGSYLVDPFMTGQIDRAVSFTDTYGLGFDVVSGRATIQTPKNGLQNLANEADREPLPDDIPVFFQWIDSDNEVSPIYRTYTHDYAGAAGIGGPGRYAFAVPQWIDANGKVHRFKSANNQKYRVWVEPTKNPATGNELTMLRTAPGFVPYAFDKASGSGLGDAASQVGTNGNVTNTWVSMYETPVGVEDNVFSAGVNYMKATGPERTLRPEDELTPEDSPEGAKLIHDTLGPIDRQGTHYDPVWHRTVSGSLYLEPGNNRTSVDGGGYVTDNPKATGADGYKVFVSALTPEGAQYKAANIDDKDESKRAELTKQMLKDHPEFLAGTVWGEPDDDGNWTLRFPEDVFTHSLPRGASDDSFSGNIYVWAEDAEGTVLPVHGSYTQPVFRSPSSSTQEWPAANHPGVNNAGLDAGNNDPSKRWNRVHGVALNAAAYQPIGLDIYNFDAWDNPAEPGETAKVRLEGRLPATDSFLEWRDKSGKVLKRCELQNTTDLGECAEFQVPEDAEPGTVYYAAITNDSNDLAADSFIVKGETNTQQQPAYDPKKVEQPDGGKVAPKWVDADGNELTGENAPKFEEGEEPTFTLARDANLPEGIKDKVTVDSATGEITLAPGVEVGSYKIPVTVMYADNSRETVTAKVEVVPVDYQPSYPGEPLKDNDGNDTGEKGYLAAAGKTASADVVYPDGEAPAAGVAEYTIAEGFNAPDGYSNVKVDPTTGKVTMDVAAAGENGADQEVVEVPVTVTYKDPAQGSEVDNVKAVFYLDTDGDGTPDTEDEDDDNDGIPDKDDSNPKVPNANDHFEPKYLDGKGKPGDDVTIDAPKFTDKNGEPTEAPDGTKFTKGEDTPDGVTIDENTGEITVTIPEDAKPGGKITVPVEVTYPDGTTDKVTVTVTVEKPDAPAEKPDWNDDKGKPGEKVEIPNTGGDVPEGTTVETEGPGKAEIDENGKLIVDIDKDAKPGDKVVVIVKDKDNNEIDRVVVEVEKPDTP